MEQIVKLTGRIAEVMPLQSGTSQRTGNQWKSQEYLFEYFPWSGATNPSRIVVRVFGEDNIAKYNLKPMEEGVTLTLRFAANKSQDGSRWFNEIHVSNVERATTEQPKQQGQVAESAPAPQADNTNNQEGEEKANDLPF